MTLVKLLTVVLFSCGSFVTCVHGDTGTIPSKNKQDVIFQTPTIAQGTYNATGQAVQSTPALALDLARTNAKNKLYKIARDRGLRVKPGSFYDGVSGGGKTNTGRYHAHITVYATLE